MAAESSKKAVCPWLEADAEDEVVGWERFSGKSTFVFWMLNDSSADTELGDFEQAIRKLFKSQDYGIALQSKRKFHKKYKNAFAGSDVISLVFFCFLFSDAFFQAVDWIVLHASCSREKAVKIGRLWEEQGDFEHVEKSQKFSDDNSFYHFIGNEDRVASQEGML